MEDGPHGSPQKYVSVSKHALSNSSSSTCVNVGISAAISSLVLMLSTDDSIGGGGGIIVVESPSCEGYVNVVSSIAVSSSKQLQFVNRTRLSFLSTLVFLSSEDDDAVVGISCILTSFNN